ncbi:hypothetical protein M758_1G298300 [Ceratodon purpureus]|nr:hypothetical protein M758_1G298300 [Ceratodon purpureus]
MAFEEALHSMHDQGLRPRLLHAVMANHLPDDKQVTRAPGQLSMAVASVRRHHLLWESSLVAGPGLHFMQGAKTLDVNKGAVDAWIEKLLNLLSSTVAENRWAGACLLGVTCQECTRQRFLECYSLWFTKLLLPLKQPTDPIFVRAAACASLTDLIVRLGGLIEFAGVRRDGANLIAKLVQPLLQILGDKDSCGIWVCTQGGLHFGNEAMDLLSALLRYFPACLRQQSSSLEALLVARIMDVECYTTIPQKCARALALLPKAHGDATTWSSLLRRILIATNSELDFAFAGMEDVATAEDAIASLLPRGQESPWPLGGRAVPSNACVQPGKSLWQQLVPRVSNLLQCCNYLLTSPFPVPVPAPLGPLLALSMRILRVDGSRLSSASRLGAPIPSSHQAALCSELPALHLTALNLVASTLRGIRSQLLPRAADLVRLISDYFRRCGGVHATLRIKLYSIARHLFVAMGAGMASGLAPAIVGNALSDLKGSTSGSNILSPKFGRGPRISNSVWASGGWSSAQATNTKKRKEPGGIPGDHPGSVMVEAAISAGEGTAPVAVQIAALQALEALLTSGGALLPDRWRAEVDAVLASVAMAAATGSISAGFASEEDINFMEGTSIASSSSGDFQVAAYQALLASLLSPCCHRPPYLAQGLAVFRNGRQEAGTEVAAVCAHALLALEPLIHPRCLPPAGTPAAVAAGMSAGRATSATLVPHMQRSNKPIPAPSPQLAGVATNTTNGFAVPASVSALKIGQLAMDPWAEVDTWLGYGEDFGDDDSLFYPETDGILVEDYSGATQGYGVSLVLNGSEGGQVAPPCEANEQKLADSSMDLRTQTVQRETLHNLQQNMHGAQSNPLQPVEKDPATIERSYQEQTGIQTPDTSTPLESSAQRQDIRPVISDTEDTEAISMCVDITVAKASGVGIPDTNQDAHLCPSLEGRLVPTATYAVTTASYPAAADTFASFNDPVEITTDSDSEGPLPAIVNGDSEPDSD